MPRVEKPHRKFVCRSCNSTFLNKSDMKRHETVHTGERPFKCDFSWIDSVTKEVFICGKGFPQRSGLNTHMNIHTGAKPHACFYCSSRFNDPSSKARHEKETHRSLGTYRCPVNDCPVGIKRRSAFVLHLKNKHGLNKNDVDIDACAPVIQPKKSRKERERAKRAFKNETADVLDEQTGRVHRVHHTQTPIVLPTIPSVVDRLSDESSTPPRSLSPLKAELLELTPTLNYRGTYGAYSLHNSYHHAASLGVDDSYYLSPYGSYSPEPSARRDQYSVQSTSGAPTPQHPSSSSTEPSPLARHLSGPIYHSPRPALMLSATQSAAMYMMGSLRPPTPPRYYDDYHDSYIGYSSKNPSYYSAYDLAPGVHEG